MFLLTLNAVAPYLQEETLKVLTAVVFKDKEYEENLYTHLSPSEAFELDSLIKQKK